MKILVSLLILVLVMGIITPVLAYPVLIGNTVTIIQLQHPDYYVIPSDISKGEIMINVKFENDGTGPFHGLMWIMEPVSNSTTNYDQIYDDSYTTRLIGISIYDITNGTKVNLDKTLFKVNSDYNLKATHDHTEGFTGTHQLEILDIEQNVIGVYDKKSTLEFEFTLSSPEFALDKNYEIDLFIGASGSNVKTFEFVDRSKKMQPVPSTSTHSAPVEINEAKNTTNESNLQTQQSLQQQKAKEDYEERKKFEEERKQWELQQQAEQERIAAEIEQNRLEKLAQKTAAETSSKQTITPEPTMIPEPTEEKKQCGAGTQLINGYCQVIQNNNYIPEPVEEKNGFFDWLMSLFGM